MKYVLSIIAVGTLMLAGCGGNQNAPGAPVGPPVITTPDAGGAPANTGAQGNAPGGLLRPGGV